MTSSYSWPWDVLGVDAQVDERSVRRAYARLLKQQRPDEDPEAFQRLRYAYESALQMVAAPIPSAPQTTHEGTAAPVPVPVPVPVQSAAIAEAPAQEPRSTPSSSPTPTARETAAELWRAFLADEHNMSSRRSMNSSISDLFDSVVSFTARDELEWLALCECLNESTRSDLRTSLCAVLDWRNNAAHLVRRDPFMAQRALAKVFADEDYATLRLRFPQAAALMEASPPRVAAGLWALRTAAMRDEANHLLRALRHYYPNVANTRFDSNTLDFWAKCVSLRLRITGQLGTASLLGALCGMLLACALVPAEQHHSIAEWGAREGLIALATVALNVGLAAVFLFNALPSLTRHLQTLRLLPSVRYGWIGLWLAISAGTLAAGPDPSTTPAAMAALALCIEWALAMHGPLRSIKTFVFVAIQVALGCGYYAHWTSADPGAWSLPLAHGALIALFCDYSLPTLRETVQRSAAWIRRLAIGWLACAALFAALLSSHAPNAAPLAWGLFAVLPVAGSVLGRTSWRTATAAVHRMVRVYLYLMALMVSLAMPNFLAVATVGLMSLWMLNDLRSVHATRQAPQ